MESNIDTIRLIACYCLVSDLYKARFVLQNRYNDVLGILGSSLEESMHGTLLLLCYVSTNEVKNRECDLASYLTHYFVKSTDRALTMFSVIS